jgi:hypothetical protein
MALTKSGFLEYLHCPKSYWVKTNRPDEAVWPAPNAFVRMLMEGGYEVEAQARQMTASWLHAQQCEFQVTFVTEGLEARADLVCRNADGTIDLFEIKSSTSVKGSQGDHVVDAAFQTAVIERAGTTVHAVHIIHVNKEYVRHGEIDPHALLVVADVTDQVRARLPEIDLSIDEALAFLAQAEIDEAGCSCIHIGNPENHCVTFARFNPDIPSLSVYILPRISRAKLVKFHQEGRFALDQIAPKELTARQALVQRAALDGTAIVNQARIAAFIQSLTWPLFFYDYETFGAAIPLADGYRPHLQMPVQFSVHRLDRTGELDHFEFLADRPGMDHDLVEALMASIGPAGTLLSWNKSTEMSCNDRLAALVPEKATFLADLNARTVDLMEPFEEDYVDARFRGSTSIKRILPVLVPTLAYNQSDVHDGTGAMQTWLQLTKSRDNTERAELERQLLAYCRLDTLAMVEIFQALRGAATEETSSAALSCRL